MLKKKGKPVKKPDWNRTEEVAMPVPLISELRSKGLYLLLIVLLSFIPLFLSGRSNLWAETTEKRSQTVLTFTFEREASIEPEKINLVVTIRTVKPTEREVLDTLGIVDSEVKKLSLEYDGGRYSVYRNCIWERGKVKCSGYTGSVRYTFKFDDPEKQGILFSALETLKEEERIDFEYGVESQNWMAEREVVEKAKKQLILKTISEAEDFVKEIEKALGSEKCVLSEINFDEHFERFFPLMAKAVPEGQVTPPVPKKEKQKVFVRARIKVECKW